MRRTILAIGGALIAIGGGALAVKRELPEFTFLGMGLAEIGIAVIVVGACLSAAGIYLFVHPLILRSVDTATELIFKEWGYVKERVLAQDLPDLYREFERFFGSDMLAIEDMTGWLKRNPDIAWRIIGKKGQDPKVAVGFFELIPLTRPAIERLNAGKLDARSMTLKHISSRGNRSSAYYIGSVAASSESRRFKFATMFKLFEHLRDLACESPITLYARPVTPDGLRLVKEYKFEKINRKLEDHESAWRLALPKNPDFSQFERLYRRIVSVRSTMRV